MQIAIPAIVLVGGPAGYDKEFSTENWTPEFILENALHGLKQRRSDKLSVTKDKAKLAELDAKILAGADLASGRGPSGSRLDDEEETDHRWLVEQGFKGKKKDLAERWKGFLRGRLVSKYPELKNDRDALEAQVAEKLEAVQGSIRELQAWKDLYTVVTAKPATVAADDLPI